MVKEGKAYSLVEAIIVVLIVGILALIAVPRFNLAIISKSKAEPVARKITTDLRLTRRLAISNAANNTKGFKLNMVGGTPYTAYQIKNLDTLETVASHTIDSSVSVTCPTGPFFEFGPLGNLVLGSGSQINISAEGKSFTITMNVGTSSIKCVEN